jgi:hypothetical protein
MPKLKQRKDGSGHYVVAKIHGTPSVGTWQLTSEGLEVVRSQGYHGDNIDFPAPLLRDLKHRGLAYTGGSGITPASLQFDFAPAQPTAATYRAASLLFVEQDEQWGLALKIGDLPAAWLECVPDLLKALEGWHIIASGTAPIPATRLYPGRGGLLIPVKPQQDFYDLKAEGRIPKGWNIDSWLVAPCGLGYGLAFFKGDTGERIPPGSMVEPDESFTIVIPESLMHDQSRLTPPPTTKPWFLGRVDQWRAWSLTVPMSPDEQLRLWCERVGLQLSRPRFRLSLATPPHAYTEDGTAIVPANEDLVLALTPLQSSDDSETNFFTTQIEQTGPMCLTVKNVLTSPLQLLVQPDRAALRSMMPPALSLKLHWGGQIVDVEALQSKLPIELLPLAKLSREKLLAEVFCPTQVSLRFEIDQQVSIRPEIPAEDAGSLLTTTLWDAVRRNLSFFVQMDAGSFGRISLVCPVQLNPQASRLPIAPAVLRRARWLATMLPVFTRSDPVVTIPHSLQTALKRVAEHIGCEKLRGVHTVPPKLLPAVRAIARDILNSNG